MIYLCTYPAAHLKVGCTLTAHHEHGIKFCSMEMVKFDLEERKVAVKRKGDEQLRRKLELMLREEEEWHQLVMYRRDNRFARVDGEYDHKLQLDRTILDMLHCPMRMHEKVLNLLYSEILNGKTKHEVNRSRNSKGYLPPLGLAAVGEHVAKEFQNAKGQVQLFVGTVTGYVDDAGTGLYSIKYEDGDVEDQECDEYAEAHRLGLGLVTVSDPESKQEKKLKATLSPALVELTNVIRDLGALGETWTHQWCEGNSKSLKKIALPLDQSKRIFKVAQLEGLKKAVHIAVPASKPDLRKRWLVFMDEYVRAIELLTCSVDYQPGDIEIIEGHIDRAYGKLLEIAGIEGCTNYFHYFGSGHIVWLSRIYGNLWRYRNEGVEGMNGILSLRYNKFNNRGGNKGSNKDGNNEKCEAFEVLGSWMSRLIMWQLGLADRLFLQDKEDLSEEKIVLWRTGRRILYKPSASKAVQGGRTEAIEAEPYVELDHWIAEEGIFLHAEQYEIDEYQ